MYVSVTSRGRESRNTHYQAFWNWITPFGESTFSLPRLIAPCQDLPLNGALRRIQ